MKRLLFSSLCLGVVAVSAQAAEPPGAQTLARPTDPSAPLRSGIDMAQIEPKVRPQDDLSGYVNGKWFATTEIPPDKPAYSAGSKIYDDTQLQLRGIVEKESAQAHPKPGAPQRIRDLYRELHGRSSPRIAGDRSRSTASSRASTRSRARRVPATIAHLARSASLRPTARRSTRTTRDSTRYIVDLRQAASACRTATTTSWTTTRGSSACATSTASTSRRCSRWRATAAAREAGQSSRSRPGSRRPSGRASRTRDPIKRYNKVALVKLPALAPGYDWKRYFVARQRRRQGHRRDREPAELHDRVREAAADQPLAAWKATSAGACWTASRRTSRRRSWTRTSPSTAPRCAASPRTGRAGSAA